MRALFIAITTALLLSCAAVDKNKSTAPYENYKLYLEALNTGNYDLAVSMLASESQKRFYAAKGGEDFNVFFPFFSSINTVVTNELNYFQNTSGSKGCLTVNGFNAAGEPASLNFELLNESGAWKFSYVQMMYHDSKKDFISFATCPPKPPE